MTVLKIALYENKIVALKLFDNGVLLSDKVINRIRSNINTLNNVEVPKRIKYLKAIVPNYKELFRTYKMDKCEILKTLPINPI